jgi:uncharacterized phage protein (predicted DNA packaging)
MSLALDVIKRYCQASDFEDDDVLLGELGQTAVDYVKGHVRRDLDAEFPNGWPKDMAGAALQLVAFWYVHREVIDGAAWNAVRKSVADILAQHRDLSA